jgi:hypothetical protein
MIGGRRFEDMAVAGHGKRRKQQTDPEASPPDPVPDQSGLPPPTARKRRKNLARTLEEIIWKLLEAIPHKVEDAPLNQLISAFSLMLETMRLLHDQPLDLERHPIDLSRMSDEQLTQLEQFCTDLLGRSPHVAVLPEEDPGGTPGTPAATGVEPALPPAPLHDDGRPGA